MHRRNILTATLAAAGALFAAGSGTRAETRAAETPKDAAKVVYHLADLDKVAFVLGNIDNHLAGVGGPEKVTISLVVHGPALRAFHAAGANADITRRLASFVKSDVKLNVCANTMRGQNVTLKDLLPGFTVAERGGVVLIAELQAQGYVYLRP